MAEDRNEASRFGGQYMVQDRDHMSEIAPVEDSANRGAVRQSEQSQTGARQQGGERTTRGQQSGGPRQSH